MEDGPKEESSLSEIVRNGFGLRVDEFTRGALIGSVHSSNETDDDSESDVLIIDESVSKKRSGKRKRNVRSSSELHTHSNPFFEESIFELSQQHADGLEQRVRPKNNSQFKEYAQYLGLQPAVQFKCSKCCRSGFETLSALNDHLTNCDADPAQARAENDRDAAVSSGFKLTRQVFLCSACGTYYENWNLYKHMLEIHKRFICLYCLGMFSSLDDLCQHIQSKHNCKPGQRDTPQEFYDEYTEPCLLICCECNKQFNEQDDFFYHNCEDANTVIPDACEKHLEHHVTGDSIQQHDSPEPGSPVTDLLPPIKECDATSVKSDTVQMVRPDTPPEITEEDNRPQPIDEPSEPMETTEIDEPPKLEPFDEEHSPKMSPENNSNDVTNDGDSLEGTFETRKVPKLSLKLPKFEELQTRVGDSDESDDGAAPAESADVVESSEPEDKIDNNCPEIQIAGPDVNIVELELEQPLDKFDIKVLLQKCLTATVPVCIYCNHARKIAVNGRQLALHAIGEHRFSAIVNSITAEELIPESFVRRIRESLRELDNVYFNLESNLSEEAVTFSHLFECFQCRYSTGVHKELYLHNRKLHTKNLLLCIMCKTSFYSYSELICHLCPGDYVLNQDVQFRCCMCVSDDLPSAFRLMVHFRKRHHVCDVCFETCHNQYKLSNHVWKHKLHHFCYRCGIAYRNKQDITRHLFWKHGTESVLCKKCLQKKWPHVYHFCIPPPSFACEECALNFTKAIYLKVHKRIHSDDKPHHCTIEGCNERFIAKKLRDKHEKKHYEPEEEKEDKVGPPPPHEKEEQIQDERREEKKEEDKDEKPKPKVDVYDLPELNLSESSDSDNEDETMEHNGLVANGNQEKEIIETLEERTLEVEQEMAKIAEENSKVINRPDNFSTAPILESIWDDFKIYQANKEKIDHMFVETVKNDKPPIEIFEPNQEETDKKRLELVLLDHDYFYNPVPSQDSDVIIETAPDLSQRVDHDYCTPKNAAVPLEEKPQEARPAQDTNNNKKASLSSSSDSDSSSCSCGSNCSCSSSSSSSSSSDSSDSDSSTEEGRKRQQARREKKRGEKAKKDQHKQPPPATSTSVDVTGQDNKPLSIITDTPILETDLSSTESETDEEFYDKQPQKLAKQLLEEKRNQILAEAGSLPNGGNLFENSRNSTPSLPEEVKPKKKSKSRKRKKKKSERSKEHVQNYLQHLPEQPPPQHQQSVVAPLTISLSQINTQHPSASTTKKSTNHFETETNLRASKRRRVPNKFYGYSSDEEQTEKPTPKWRKSEPPPPTPPPPPPPPPPTQPTPARPNTPLTTPLVPPLTIKTGPMVQPITIRSTATPGELRVHNQRPRVPPLQINASRLPPAESDSNDSGDEQQLNITTPQVNTTQLYCYCRCPYDEVSEMIGCDSHDCAIEWFHFECVGIMVPPKGQWFCPDCRKRKQQRREYFQS